MKTIRITYIIAIIISTLSLIGCTKESNPEISGNEETGVVRINVACKPETKVPLGSPDDERINDLTVWLVSTADNIIEAVSITEPDSGTATVEFDEVSRGNHTLYIVANYKGLNAGYTVGKAIDDDFLNTSLGPIADKESPAFTAESGIPSSLVTHVSVAPGVNNVNAHLVRAVGRMSITFRNVVQGYDLWIGDVILTKRNQSQGFLFNQGDHSLPSGTVAYDFPDLDGLKKIPEAGSVKVFDHYLFETSTSFANPFHLSFAAGLYTAGTPEADIHYSSENVSYRNVTIGNNTNQIGGTEKTYLIRSGSSSSRYIGFNGTGLILGDFDNDNLIRNLNDEELKRYLWKFSNTSGSTTITNVSDPTKSITLNTTTAGIGNSGSNLDITTSGNYIRFSYSTSSWFNTTTYYLATNTSYNNMIGTTSTSGTQGNARNWYLREVTVDAFSGVIGKFTGAEKDVTTENTYTINYIDNYGAPAPLQHICRNEHVDIVVNIRYNEELGMFQFDVLPWDTVENETTFD